jgi:hypothetical protein
MIIPQSPMTFTLASNAFTHALLYGSYEGLKRNMGNQQQRDHRTDLNSSDTPLIHDLSSYAISGGCAGVLHHICSHVMEAWRERIPMTVKDSRQVLLDDVKNLLPTGKSTIFAFLSHAMGFVAFEFGKEIINNSN